MQQLRFSRKQRYVLIKTAALLSIIRWYNIILIAIAQYVASFFVFGTAVSKWKILFDYKIHIIVFSGALIIAGGYIINSFYDLEKDLVNRPKKTLFGRLISKSSCLYFYFIFNGIGLGLSILASVNVFLFFSGFAFLLWFYSHKLQKIAFVREMAASFLAVLPFFAIVIYFRVTDLSVYVYGSFVFLQILIRETVKGFLSYKGDVIYGYNTVVVNMGFKKAKWIIGLLTSFSILPIIGMYLKLNHFHPLIWLLVFSAVPMIFGLSQLKGNNDLQFRRLNNLYKILIPLSVFGILLLKV